MVLKRVNGKDLSQKIKSDVIIIGKVNRVNSSRQNIEISSADDQIINVNLPTSLPEGADSYIEVWGHVLSKSTIQASSFVGFPAEMCTDYDPKVYNEYLLVSNVLGDKKWRFSAEDEPYV